MVCAFWFGRLWSTTSEVLLSIDRALCFNRLEAATSGVLLSMILRFVLVDFGALHQKHSCPSLRNPFYLVWFATSARVSAQMSIEIEIEIGGIGRQAITI